MAKVFAMWSIIVVGVAIGLLLLAFITEKLCYAIYNLQNRIRARRKSGK